MLHKSPQPINTAIPSTSTETITSGISKPAVPPYPKVQNHVPDNEERNATAIEPFQLKPNKTGLPDNLKSGIENLSGHSMDDVKVHYNSSQPAQLNALAYAQGTQIHIAPGQERHLPHEAWHVVQQKRGMVQATTQLRSGVQVNDDPTLEKDADTMGAQAADFNPETALQHTTTQLRSVTQDVVQRLTGYEVETQIPVFGPHNEVAPDMLTPAGRNGFTEEIGQFLIGGLEYGLDYGSDPEGRFQISADHNDLSTLHVRLIDKLLLVGLLSDKWRHRGMANIEYVTPPRNELSPASKLEHAADIAAVKTHLNITLSAARSNQIVPIVPPARNILTGVPISALYKWLAINNIPTDFIATELEAFMAAISNEVYIQETSGVLPEDVPAVYAEAADKMSSTTDPGILARIMSEMMMNSITVAQTAFETTTNKPAEWTTHQKAITGFLTLLTTYVQADELSFLKIFSGSSSVAKNMLPFMSKAKLEDAITALPPEVLPGATKDIWTDCTGKLLKLAGPFDRTYWTKRYSHPLNQFQVYGTVFPNGAANEITKLINNEKITMYAITGRPLGLDKPHDEVKARTGQQSIPLEDRYFKQKFGKKLTAENMEVNIAGRFDFATRLQLSHLPEEGNQRKDMEVKTNTPMSLQEQVQAFAMRISDNVASLKKINKLLIEETLMTDELNTTSWEAQIGTILTTVAPDHQQEALEQVNKQVNTKLAELHEILNIHVNKSKTKDHQLTYEEAFLRFAERNGDPIVGTLLLDFRNRVKQFRLLKEKKDRDQLRSLIDSVDKGREFYYKHKQKFVENFAQDKPVEERLKLFDKFKLLAPGVERILKKQIAAVYEHYDTHDKKEEKTDTPSVLETTNTL